LYFNEPQHDSKDVGSSLKGTARVFTAGYKYLMPSLRVFGRISDCCREKTVDGSFELNACQIVKGKIASKCIDKAVSLSLPTFLFKKQQEQDLVLSDSLGDSWRRRRRRKKGDAEGKDDERRRRKDRQRRRKGFFKKVAKSVGNLSKGVSTKLLKKIIKPLMAKLVRAAVKMSKMEVSKLGGTINNFCNNFFAPMTVEEIGIWKVYKPPMKAEDPSQQINLRDEGYLAKNIWKDGDPRRQKPRVRLWRQKARDAQSYAVAKWCKAPLGHNDTMIECSKATRQKNALNKQFYTGTEDRMVGRRKGVAGQIPYVKFAFKRFNEEKDTESLCEVDFYLQFLMCTTCCCTKGLIMADKKVMLTKTDKKGVCADWYYAIDMIAGFTLGVMRTIRSAADQRNFFGNCVKV